MCFAPQRHAPFEHLNFQECSESVSYNTFAFQMCFAPQRRALFGHLNLEKWSHVGVLCTFWLGNVLRATTGCNCSSLIWPDGSAPAALASLLFDPPEPQIIGNTQWIATFLPFRAPASSFLWLFLFSDLLSSSLLFSSLTLPTSAFPSVHIVGSLASKLPSIMHVIYIYNVCYTSMSIWKRDYFFDVSSSRKTSQVWQALLSSSHSDWKKEDEMKQLKNP